MRRLSMIGGALAIGLMALAAACGNPESRVPLSPSQPTVAGLQVSGPASVAPGQSAQFLAATRLSDGTVKSSTSALNLRWRSSNTSVVQVTASGLVTAGQNRGEAVVTAELLPAAVIRGSREVIVLPDGTYRVVGSVREAEAPTVPIVGARVEVSGTSLSATTDFNGQYRLYGVPPTAEIRVTANGYQTSVQTVQLAAHTTQNFQLALSGPRLSLNGLYRLAIDTESSCSSLPGDLQHRTYDATVTTTGSLVNVLLTEPRFRLNSGLGNRFSGRADAVGVRFTLDFFYSYFFYFYYPSIAEQLPNNTVLTISGTATTSSANGGLSGPLNGTISNYDSRFPASNSAILGSCSGLRLTLTPR